jgi:hypothetical protein
MAMELVDEARDAVVLCFQLLGARIYTSAPNFKQEI